MDKKEYITKTFSRTKRKDYENYVLNGIWHRVHNLNLEPVSQQYVKRPDGHYALLDLYFPQIHFAIEVDEGYHKKDDQCENDSLRMDDVLSALNSDEWLNCNLETNSDLFHRISVAEEKSIEEIDGEIDAVVEKIQEAIEKYTKEYGALVWETDDEKLAQLAQRDTLYVTDNITFRLIKDIANNIFGKSYPSLQITSYSIDKERNLRIWCPKLALKDAEGNYKAAARAWVNILSDDWNIIDERNEKVDSQKTRNHFEKEKANGICRATFAKYRDNLGYDRYRFIGIFQADTIGKDNTLVVYKRVSEEIKITH